MCMMVLGIGTSAQIQLGSGTSTTSGSDAVPWSNYYKLSYSQQIIKKSELNTSAGNITGLKFFLGSTATLLNSNEIVVYLGHTANDTFASTTSWIPASSLTQVFAGTVTNTNGVVEITFTTPFAYNNTDNLVVAVDENKDGYDNLASSTEYFYKYSVTSNSSLYYRNDTTNPDPDNPTIVGTRSGYRAVMQVLGLMPAAPPACSTISAPATGATGTSITPTFSWAAATGATSYVVSLGTTPGGNNIMNNVDVGYVTSYTLPAASALSYMTTYYLTVSPKNAAGTATGCTETNFTTKNIPCPSVSAPSSAATGVSRTPVFTWAASDGATGYKISIGTTAGGTDIANNLDVGNVTTYTYNTPLNYNTKYFYTIKSYNATLTSSGCSERTFTTLSFCPTVSAPSSSATGVALKPVFTWSAHADATGYKLTIGTTPGGVDVLNGFDVGNVLTYTYPNELNFNTKYYYTINSYNATNTSSGCSERNFTTLSICPTVSAPASSAADVPVNPTFTWAAVTGVNGYKLRIGTTPGGTDIMNNVDVGNVTTYTLPTALNNSTVYYYSVGAYTATQSLTACTERSFITVCSPVGTFFENFDGVTSGSWPICWGKVGTGGSANTQAGAVGTSPNVLYMYSTSTSSLAVVKMRPVSTLNSGMYRLRFKARSNSTVGGKIEVGYLTDPALASSFVSLGVYTTTSTSVVDNFILNNITAPAGVTTLAFRHTGSPASSVLIDDVYYELAPTCLEPTAIVASNMSTQTADISWTAPASAPGGGYEIYYSTSGLAPTAATVPSVTDIMATNKTLSDLLPSTMYNVWIRSSCSNADKGIWVGPLSFATACGSIVPNYSNDFSSFPGVCWSLASGGSPATGPTGTSALWAADGFLNVGTTGAARINLYDTDRVGWLKTVPFNLSAGGYKVEFDYGVTAYGDTTSSAMGSDDTLQFIVSTDGGATWTVLKSWGAANGPSNTLNTYSLDLTGYNSPNTIFAFYGSSGTVDNVQDYDFFIDNFKISASQLSTSEAEIKGALKVYPNPFSDILHISDISKVQSVSVVDLAGRVVKTIEKPSSELHLADLKQGMYLVILHMKDGSKQVVKSIKR